MTPGRSLPGTGMMNGSEPVAMQQAVIAFGESAARRHGFRCAVDCRDRVARDQGDAVRRHTIRRR